MVFRDKGLPGSARNEANSVLAPGQIFDAIRPIQALTLFPEIRFVHRNDNPLV